jgi:hypothetical protein
MVKNGSGNVAPPQVSDQMLQCRCFVQGDVVSLIAYDLVLGIATARVMDITLIFHVFYVYFHYPAADAASFGIPADMVADFE